MSREHVLEQGGRNMPWGLLSCIDLYDCDPQTIRDEGKIRQFVRELCDLIKIKRLEKPRWYTLVKMRKWRVSP